MTGFNELNAVSKYYFLEYLFKFKPRVFVAYINMVKPDYGELQGVMLQFRYKGLVKDLCSSDDRLNFTTRLLTDGPKVKYAYQNYCKPGRDQDDIISKYLINNQLYMLPYLIKYYRGDKANIFLTIFHQLSFQNNFYKIYIWLLKNNYITFQQIIETGLVNSINDKRVLIDIINSNISVLYKITIIHDHAIFVLFINRLIQQGNTNWSLQLIKQCIKRNINIDIIDTMLNNDSAWQILYACYKINFSPEHIALLLKHMTEYKPEYNAYGMKYILINNLAIIEQAHRLGMVFNFNHLILSLEKCSNAIIYFLIRNIEPANQYQTLELLNKLVKLGYLAPIKLILSLPRKYNLDGMDTKSWTDCLNEALRQNHTHLQHFIIQYCIENKFYIDINSCLIKAVNSNNLGAVKTVLKFGADPNYNQAEALYRAKYNNNTEIVQLLLEQGAKETLASNHGSTRGYMTSQRKNVACNYTTIAGGTSNIISGSSNTISGINNNIVGGYRIVVDPGSTNPTIIQGPQGPQGLQGP